MLRSNDERTVLKEMHKRQLAFFMEQALHLFVQDLIQIPSVNGIHGETKVCPHLFCNTNGIGCRAHCTRSQKIQS